MLFNVYRTIKVSKNWILIAFLLIVSVSNAQKYAYNWNFGCNAGITFKNGAPEYFNGSALCTMEGCSSISDANGDIMFYSDGLTVYNRNNQIMLNGTGLLGNISSTQSSIIVPKPGSNRYFYIFTVPELDEWYGLRYSLVDMELDGGLGGLVNDQKNVFLQANVAEKLGAIRQANNIDYWIVVHERDSRKFRIFSLTDQGINPVPVTQEIGSYYPSGAAQVGYLRFSHDGQYLACAVRYPGDFVEIYNFDRATAGISNPVKILNAIHPYGLEFSPKNQFLYFGLEALSKVFQVDLRSHDSLTIVNSTLLVHQFSTWLGAFQLGLDGKIYISETTKHYLHSIDYPDSLGYGCHISENTLFLNTGEARLGLPTFVGGFLIDSIDFSYNDTCYLDSTSFVYADSLSTDSILWCFNDPLTLDNNYSRLMAPIHCFSSVGSYLVILKVYRGGEVTNVEKLVHIVSVPSNILGGDLVVCNAGEVTLSTNCPYSSYLWNTGCTERDLVVNASGVYTVVVTNASGCVGVDEVVVAFNGQLSPIAIKHY